MPPAENGTRVLHPGFPTPYLRPFLRDTAERSGGQYYTDRNDLDSAMRRALDETRESYTLGYYIPDDTPKGDHNIRVNVSRRDTKLRYRQTYEIGDQ